MNNLKAAVESFPVRLSAILLSIFLTGYMVIHGKEILSPLVIALLLAILVLPLANFMESRLRFGRSLASFTSVILLVCAIGLLLYLLGAQFSKLGQDWPLFKEQVYHLLDSLSGWIESKFKVDANKQLGYVRDATSGILSSSTVMLGTTVLSVSSILLFLVFVMIYTFFLLFYRRLITRFLESVFNENNKPLVHEILEKVQNMTRKYITGLLLEMAIVSVICCLAFLILGVKYAILLGLVVGIFNIIPYIGIFSALLFSTLITFATGAAFTKVGAVGAIIIIVHLLDSNFLLPVIVGSKVRINAMVTIIGVIVGEMMWGISGMFLSIPVIAIMKIIFDRIEGLQPWGLLLGDEK